MSHESTEKPLLVLNHETVAGLKNLGEGVLAELFLEFVAIFQKQSKELKALVTQKDPEEVLRVAHCLKGSCWAMGGEKLAATCQEIENLAADAFEEGVLKALVEQLDVEFEELCPELKREL